jgi:hypothetical protein
MHRAAPILGHFAQSLALKFFEVVSASPKVFDEKSKKEAEKDAAN